MKKKYALIIGVLLVAASALLLRSINSKSITFPFLVSEVVQIEMHHYEGVPAAEECKIITQMEDIETLYNDLQKIKLRDIKETAEPMTGGSAIRFKFLLADDSVYEVKSSNSGVHQTISLPEENVTYITSANIEKYWKHFSYEIVDKQENESNVGLVFVLDRLFYNLEKDVSAEVFESLDPSLLDTPYIGTIQSIVDNEVQPSEELEANFDCLGAEVVFYDNGIAINIDGKWIAVGPLEHNFPYD